MSTDEQAPILEISLDGRILYANLAVCKLFPGIESRQTGHPYLAGWDELVAILRQRPELRLNREVTVGNEVFEQSIEFLKDLQRVRVSGRRRSEETASEIRCRTQDIIESISDGLVGLDRDWRFIYINRQAAQNVGYEPEQLTGKNIWETFPDILGTDQEMYYRQVMEQRQFAHFELDGVLTQQSYDIRICPTNEGICVHWLDITQQKLAEQKLKDSERKYRDLILYAPAGIYEIDFRSRRFTSVNDAMCEYTGYSREELLQLDVLAILDEDSQRRFQQRIFLAQAGKKLPENVEYCVRAKDGHEIITLLNTTFIRDEKGRIIGATVIGQVITERKRAEIALQKANATLQQQAEELEAQAEELQSQASELRAANEKLQETNVLLDQRVYERTRELQAANQELKSIESELRSHNEALAQSLDREKTLRTQLIQAEKFEALARLVGSVAHEINNPLQTVKNCLFLLRSNPTPENRAELMNMAVSETQRMADLVQQLRQTYRPNKLQPVDFNLMEVLERVSGLLGPQFKENKVAWQVRAPLDCILLHGIPDQLQQVCLNICLNAIEAMGPAGGRLDLAVTLPPGQQRVCLSFLDDGPGIPEEHLPEVFEPFFTTKEKGMGLGLAICYEIVKSHGGEISVESQAGNGATFTVWLPAAV